MIKEPKIFLLVLDRWYRILNEGGEMFIEVPKNMFGVDYHKLINYVNAKIGECRSDVVLVDPLLPTGLIIPKLRDVAKLLIVHGAEVTVPGRIYPTKKLAQRATSECDVVVSAGNYAAREIVRATGKPINLVRIPPGVDVEVFSPPSDDQRAQARRQLCNELGISEDSQILMSASRLVPRKGFDVAISALSDIDKDIHLVIVGKGRDRKRLETLAQKREVSDRVHFLGTVSLTKLVATYHASDLFLMLCRDRWGSLEAEGFGIVFLEAAACGLPVIAGRSGGSDEALLDGKSGFVVDPESLSEIREKIRMILGSSEIRSNFGKTGRQFVERDHSYDYLATLLLPLVTGDLSSAKPFDG